MNQFRFKAISYKKSNSLTLSLVLLLFVAVILSPATCSGISYAGEVSCGGDIYIRKYTGFPYTPTYLTSPFYPFPYQANHVCIWKITVHKSRAVALRFLDFETEYHRHCRFDYVEVRDGSSSRSPLLGKYCGHRKPKDVYSTGRHLYVKFASNPIRHKKGFKAFVVQVAKWRMNNIRNKNSSPENITLYHTSRAV